ncbi:hypothetical protein HOLleu_39056 [Holothuria leucospilota]|uniref:Uncharacterized protein n=1 Tax=Holothuria leucospilota TaxID=206669 RepID=A0A9Q0YJS6_HOLLE|nr:hypothetical protein HOLleu_39056 [Holothuria leucospilota]
MQLIRVTEQELVESQRFHQVVPQPKPQTAHAAQTQKRQDKEKTADSDLQALLKKTEERLARLETTADKGERKENSPQTNNQGKDGPRGKGPIKCYRFGQGGHIVRHCKNPPTTEWAAWHLNSQGTLPGCARRTKYSFVNPFGGTFMSVLERYLPYWMGSVMFQWTVRI